MGPSSWLGLSCGRSRFPPLGPWQRRPWRPVASGSPPWAPLCSQSGCGLWVRWAKGGAGGERSEQPSRPGSEELLTAAEKRVVALHREACATPRPDCTARRTLGPFPSSHGCASPSTLCCAPLCSGLFHRQQSLSLPGQPLGRFRSGCGVLPLAPARSVPTSPGLRNSPIPRQLPAGGSNGSCWPAKLRGSSYWLFSVHQSCPLAER
ncbi:chromosome 1 orf 53 [Chelydra serpentina]|uniref:Uncharacterized protein n=1 Tax=Chelydra serpentina TaxID=8475 RepID=A0A8T1SH49_CHESE|nr:chromosome 1 orf 53 [Chelydra serpentina]